MTWTNSKATKLSIAVTTRLHSTYLISLICFFNNTDKSSKFKVSKAIGHRNNGKMSLYLATIMVMQYAISPNEKIHKQSCFFQNMTA